MSDTAIIETPASGEPIDIDDLTRMLEESRNRTTTLERERDEERDTRRRIEQERDHATTQVKSAAEQRYAAEVSATEMALNAAKAAADHAKGAYRTAMEAGDFAAAAEAQEAIADAATQRAHAAQRKTWLETEKERLIQAPAPTRTEAPKPSGKYSQYVGDLRDSEAQWLDARPEFVSDPKYRSKVFGASQIASTEFDRGTPDYFRRMEEILGEGRAEASRETPRQQRQQSADLPAGGPRAPGSPQGGSREVRLSADEAEIADALYGNPSADGYIADQGARYKHYAANKERMKSRF
jgi:hypothetical protein